jgi:hypothetical protein
MRVVSKIGFHTPNDMRFQRIDIIFVSFTCCNGKMSNSYMDREENPTNLCSPAYDLFENVVVGAVVVVVGFGVVEVIGVIMGIGVVEVIGVIVDLGVVMPVVDGSAQQIMFIPFTRPHSTMFFD